MAKPVVDGLEHRLQGSMRVMRVDVNSEAGAELAGRYNVRMLPSYVLVDGHGGVLYQQSGGRPNTSEIELRVRNYRHTNH